MLEDEEGGVLPPAVVLLVEQAVRASDAARTPTIASVVRVFNMWTYQSVRQRRTRRVGTAKAAPENTREEGYSRADQTLLIRLC